MSLWQQIKQFVKDSIVGATSTHGGVAGGTAAGRSRRKKKSEDREDRD